MEPRALCHIDIDLDHAIDHQIARFVVSRSSLFLDEVERQLEQPQLFFPGDVREDDQTWMYVDCANEPSEVGGVVRDAHAVFVDAKGENRAVGYAEQIPIPRAGGVETAGVCD